MNKTNSSHPSHPARARLTVPVEMVMPRLTHDQMLAILREGGVPESEARRWVDHEARLALDVASAAE